MRSNPIFLRSLPVLLIVTLALLTALPGRAAAQDLLQPITPKAPKSSNQKALGPSSPITFFEKQPDFIIRKASALVNGQVITDLDVTMRLNLALVNARKKPNSEQLVFLRRQVRDALIVEKLQLQEAENYEAVVGDSAVNRQFAKLAQNNGRVTPKVFAKMLKELGSSEQTLKEQIKAQLSWERLVRGMSQHRNVAVSDSEVQSRIDRMMADKGKMQYRFAEIYRSSNPATDQEVLELMTRLREQMQDGRSFAVFARQFSESSTAAAGGDKGLQLLSQLPEVVHGLIPKMKIGDITPVLKSGAGYLILRLLEKKEVLGADPAMAKISLKRVTTPLPENPSSDQIRSLLKTVNTTVKQAQGGCGNAESIAKKLNGTADTIPTRPLREFSDALRPLLAQMAIGQSSPPFRESNAVSIVILCGREMPQEGDEPSFDLIYANIMEQRLGLFAQRYLRDIQRNAIIDYR